MSVIVKGMEMPKNCTECRFAIDGWCYAYGRPNWQPWETFGRTNFCPLVPVPPHRDLIDREWLLDIALQLMNTAKNDDIFNGVKWLWQYILETPTIIEAEDEDNG